MPIVKNGSTPIKRALLLFGSPHKNGSTAQLVKVLREACSPEYVWDIWYCFDHEVKPCDDCRYCYHNDGCSKTDLDIFYSLLESVDLLVIATPVYNLSYSAPLKTLLDRTQRYWASRFVRGKRPPIQRAKKAILLTVAELDSDGGNMVERQLRPTLTILNATLTASVHVLRREDTNAWRQRVIAAVELLGC